MFDVDFDGERLNVRLNKTNYKIILKIAEEAPYSEYLQDIGVMCLPPTKKIARKLVDIGLRFNDTARVFSDALRPSTKELTPIERAFAAKNLIDFSVLAPLELRPYQKEGVMWLVNNNGHLLLGDEMGLGKSIQIASYLFFSRTLPALIICPASLKLNWEREIGLWTNCKCLVLEGLTPYPIDGLLDEYPVVIINYDILGRKDKQAVEDEDNRVKAAKKLARPFRKKTIHPTGWVDVLKKIKFKNIICDECQFIGEKTTARTQAVIDICKGIPNAKRIFVSGTPYTSVVKQFFTILNLIASKIFSNRWKYQMDYCDPVHGCFGWEFRGLSNGEQLHNIVKTFMLRRLKSEVLPDLPPKVKMVVPVKVDQKLFKNYLVDENYILAQDNDQGFHKLKFAAYRAKVEACYEWVNDFIEANGKLVLFIYHREAFADAMKKYEKIAVGINGETPANQRQGIVDRFQNDKKIKLFVGQIEAAGVGLTLTAASAVAFIEFGDTAAEHEQAEDRIHRIGQEHDSVFAYYLIAKNTIDEDIVKRIKKGYANQKLVLDGKKNAKFMKDGKKDFAEAIMKSRRARYEKS